MAPIFAALDRTNYRRLIPQHLADCLLLPPSILSALSMGGFTVSITGSPWHSVAIDEGHEMLINKDCKEAITRPSKDLVNQLALYFPFRAQCQKNLKTQVYPKDDISTLNEKNNKKTIDNIKAIKNGIKSSNLLPVSYSPNLTLRNPFTGVTATAEQQHDLLRFEEIGQEDFQTIIKYTYLKDKSCKLKNHNLKTFTTKKVTKRNYTQLQKEKQLVATCLKKRLIWLQEHGEESMSNNGDHQFLELPRALCSSDGLPNKGQKSTITSFFKNKYPSVFLSKFPSNWLPQSVIIEGMIIINVTPIRIHHSKMIDYANFLFQRFIVGYLIAGVIEVHIVFDSPGMFAVHPKDIERKRRDSDLDAEHEHIDITDDSKIPSKWNSIIGCRTCKRSLVTYLGDAFLLIAPALLRGPQKLYVAGYSDSIDRNTCWFVTCDGVEEICPHLTSNSDMLGYGYMLNGRMVTQS